ncbi:hypothetical protein M8J77_025997 [Diaphorina citri]|nr:hypothetical protein M8J77_025997 [Diaphorina citri]
MGKGSSQRKVSSGLQQNMKTNLYNLPRVPSLGPRICRAYTISPRTRDVIEFSTLKPVEAQRDGKLDLDMERSFDGSVEI